MAYSTETPCRFKEEKSRRGRQVAAKTLLVQTLMPFKTACVCVCVFCVYSAFCVERTPTSLLVLCSSAASNTGQTTISFILAADALSVNRHGDLEVGIKILFSLLFFLAAAARLHRLLFFNTITSDRPTLL